MAEKVLKPGVPLELVGRKYKLDDAEAQEKKMASSIHDLGSENRLTITNPMIKSRLIPLHSGERYNAYFFASKIYTAPIEVIKSRSEGNIRVVDIKLSRDIEKYERRAFYRLETSIPVRYLVLTPENANEFREATKNGTLLRMPGFQSGTTLDISGGGIRFTSKAEIAAGAMVITHLVAESANGQKKNYIFLGKLIRTGLLNNQRGNFEHCMQFIDMKQEAREEFVRFIFEWEREKLKKMSGITD
ncbi:MAG: flagellar brake protein [Lachnospiraceae bacterium]|nr:flagellar brake protein [Lachnospiraceae bacterium]